MYWQVYLHKTVLSAEMMLVNLLKRAKLLAAAGDKNLETGGAMDYFIYLFEGGINKEMLDKFSQLDDIDVSFAIKRWSNHPDFVLSELCKRLLNRKLLKIKLQSEPFEESFLQQKLADACLSLGVDEEAASYFVFNGEADNTMYNMGDDKINIVFKDGTVKDIANIDNPLIHQTISAPIKKFYICSLA